MSQTKNKPESKPVVLCFSGHDPSGGAGIQADIEAISAQGCHAATVITALTSQDTHHVLSFNPVDAGELKNQADVLFKDMTISAIKIGMTGDVEIVKAIHTILKAHNEIPVILDPVLASGAGNSLSSTQLVNAINTYLLPYCQLITPNIPEAFKLSNCTDNTETAAKILLEMGAERVLITGTHAKSTLVEHYLHHAHEPQQQFQNTRLPHEYHGSGCTLASSIAAFIAKGLTTGQAVQKGLDYSYQTLQHAHAPGQGQWLPDRLYKLDND